MPAATVFPPSTSVSGGTNATFFPASTAVSGGSGATFFPSTASAPVMPTIAGLKLDLDANVGVTLTSGKVSTWADQSGLGNDFTQGTAGDRPVVTASVFGSLPGVTNTAATVVTAATSPLTIGSARTVFAVIKGTGSAGASGGAIIQFKTGAAGQQYIVYLWDLSPNIYCYGNGTIADTIAGVTVSGSAHVYMETATVGALPVVQVDGAAQTVSGGNNVTSDNGSDGAFVGNIAGKTQGFVGHIGRLLVYDTVLSAGNITLVKAYLAAVYGITVV